MSGLFYINIRIFSYVIIKITILLKLNFVFIASFLPCFPIPQFTFVTSTASSAASWMLVGGTYPGVPDFGTLIKS